MNPSPPQSDGAPAEDAVAALDARRRFVFGRIVWLWLGLFLGFAAVDAVVARVDAADSGGEMELGHPLLGWTNTAGHGDDELDRHHDRFGLRGEDIPDDADPRELRILGLGDSRIYGAGEGVAQADVWNHALEDLLNAGRRRPVRVLNGGVMGYSVAQSCRRAVTLLDAVEPDLVFVAVSTSAQALLEDPDLGGFVEVDGRFVSRALASRWDPRLLPAVALTDDLLSRYSAIYSRHKNREVMQGTMPPIFLRWRYFDRVKDRDYLLRCLDATWASIRDLKAACEARGIELRMAVIPTSEMATPDRWQKWVQENAAIWQLPSDVVPQQSLNALKRTLRRDLGVEVWDLSGDVFEMGRNFDSNFIWDDVHHWTPRGHERIAAGLMRELLADGLLKRLNDRRTAAPRERAFGTLAR